jgi:predicted transcriptional regulator
MKNWGNMEIIDSMLHAEKSGATKFRVMTRACLSHKQLKEYLALLEHCGLIATDVETGRYNVTKKGGAIHDTLRQDARTRA